MGDTKTEVARGGDLAQIGNGTQLQASDFAGAVLHEQHLVRGATGGDFSIGHASQEYRGHTIPGAHEQTGVLTGAVQERPIITVAELQHMSLSRACHKHLRRL
ncbi:hypothetical protein D3C76_1713110 [compost metagenome]